MTRKSAEPNFSEDKPLTISTKTLALPLWQVWSLVVGCMTFTAYAMALLNTINAKLDALDKDRWKLSYQREWKYQMERSNPGKLIVPDPDEIVKKFNP